MPDLTIEIYACCEDVTRSHHLLIGQYEVTLDPYGNHHCTCPAFKFGKGKECKHIKKALDTICTWREFTDEPQEVKGVCPRCGGSTTYEKYAV